MCTQAGAQLYKQQQMQRDIQELRAAVQERDTIITDLNTKLQVGFIPRTSCLFVCVHHGMTISFRVFLLRLCPFFMLSFRKWPSSLCALIFAILGFRMLLCLFVGIGLAILNFKMLLPFVCTLCSCLHNHFFYPQFQDSISSHVHIVQTA